MLGDDDAPDQDPGADLEYDLAHEGEQAGRPDPAGHDRQEGPVQVATETPGFDSDYSYDLAHDVPRAEPG